MQGLTPLSFTQIPLESSLELRHRTGTAPWATHWVPGAVGPFSEDCSGNQSPPSELPSGWKSQQIPSWVRALIRCRRACLRAVIHMEIHDTVHGADRDVHYNTGEGSTENDKELLSCLQSPPSNTHVKSFLHSASVTYCSAKSDKDFLPSPLHLCSSAAGWKVANQRQRNSVMPRRN